jgi:hypothetical protein
MEQIDWSTFGLKGESKQKSFEDLSMYLFCRELKIAKINAYQNQPGIETDPVEVDGKRYGFQSKFFESSFDWEQLGKSLNKAFETYPELDKIFIYSNKDKTLAGKSKTKGEIRIEKNAASKKIDIEYVTDKTLMKMLSQPANLDLAQLFFGAGDEIGFIKNSVNPNILTFLQSSECLELPVVNNLSAEIKNLSSEILSREEIVYLILGNPGSGKSILVNKLLQEFGGLDKSDKTKMLEVLIKNNATPVLINLKNCATDSFDNILRNKKNDSKLNGRNLKFIYIFDGLDELNEELADSVLFQIQELTHKSDTKKIIFSCRRGNLNRSKANVYLNDIVEYQISELEEGYIDDFFKAKKNGSKDENLKKLKRVNQALFKEIKDILLIKLLWDTINNLDERSIVLDLFQEKINLLIDNPLHRKNIEELNLLNPKKEAIIDINQDISFEYSKKFQFNFSQNDLQRIILNKFSRLDYKSVNTIINYIADLFFENSYLDEIDSKTTYIYQHRRYQEYFFTQRLKTEYEMNPKILRELGVVSDREYLEGLFLKYLRKEYIKENNLNGLVELNLIDVYLGNDRSFGADDDYYKSSSNFIPALVCQNQNNYDNLLDELKIKDKISLNISEIDNYFEKWKKENNDYLSIDYLKKVWEDGIAFLINNIVACWKGEKKETVNILIFQLEYLLKLFEENNFFEKLDESDQEDLGDPLSKTFDKWVYYKLVINEEKVIDVFNTLIRNNYMNLGEVGKERMVKSFFRVCLREKSETILELIEDCNHYEFVVLLEVLNSIDYIPVFIKSESLHHKVRVFAENMPQDLVAKNPYILFYKKFFNIDLTNEEQEVAGLNFEKLKGTRSIDWTLNEKHIDFAYMSFVLDKCSFENFVDLDTKKQNLPVYNELNLFACLFKDFILILKKEKSISAIIRDYIRYINLYRDNIQSNPGLKVDNSSLWGRIFSNCDIDRQSLLKLKNILVKEEFYIHYYNFYTELSNQAPELFNQLISEDDIKLLEEELLFWEGDYSTLVDRCFDVSIYFSNVDSDKSKFYFNKGVNEGVLRHGFHKDTIVSYLLTDTLEIILRNNWLSKETIKVYSKKVLDLNLRLRDITDGDHTWRGPYRVIEILSENNQVELAEEYNLLIKNRGNYSSAITSILISKVNNGLPIKEIEQGMEEYTIEYDRKGKHKADYYEQHFKVYIEIATCELYTDKEKKIAFENAYEQVEKTKYHNVDFAFLDENSWVEKKIFKRLCQEYGKPFNLVFEEKEDTGNKSPISEDEFIEKVKSATTNEHIQEIYKDLNEYSKGIILTKYNSWEILIEKTLEINKNIHLFIVYLEENNYPRINFWSRNSEFLHFGLASALKNMSTRQETFNYLYDHSGHGGFTNIIKAFEVLGDKNTCLSMFNRYLNFCELLVN